MEREINIGGMTPDTYDPDKDPRGDIGHALADAVWAKYGAESSASTSSSQRAYWGSLTRLALRRFPECNLGERIHIREVKKRLSLIREAGYDVPQYSKLDNKQSWQLLSEVREDIRRQAETYCPEVLENILEHNSRQKTDARGPLR